MTLFTSSRVLPSQCKIIYKVGCQLTGVCSGSLDFVRGGNSVQQQNNPTTYVTVLQSLLTSLVLTRLDYGNANLAGIPLYLLKRLQSVMNSAARLVFSLSRYDHITPLLRQLHWLKTRERIDFKLALLIYYTCQHGAAPSYLADELSQPADVEARCRLRSASSSSLIIRRAPLSTIGDRAFPVAAARVCNSLPQHVTPASSLSVFRSRLKTPL